MLEEVSDTVSGARTALIPVLAGEERAYITVQRINDNGVEEEISGKIPSFDEVIGRITTLASGAVNGLRATGASKVVLEFGCEVGVEAGQIVAIIGKASGKSTFKVGLEWSDPKPAT